MDLIFNGQSFLTGQGTLKMSSPEEDLFFYVFYSTVQWDQCPSNTKHFISIGGRNGKKNCLDLFCFGVFFAVQWANERLTHESCSDLISYS